MRAWREAFIVGALLIVGGTALVGWAELSVPSGITSLILATTPLWMVLLEGLSSGRAPAPRVLAGVAVGLGGLAILIWPSLMSPGARHRLVRRRGARAAAALTWSVGALYSRRVRAPGFGGARNGHADARRRCAFAGAWASHSVSTGQLSVAAITPASLAAIAYLVDRSARSSASAPTCGSCACPRRRASRRTRT